VSQVELGRGFALVRVLVDDTTGLTYIQNPAVGQQRILLTYGQWREFRDAIKAGQYDHDVFDHVSEPLT
jgi:hypothetical protein